MTGTGNDKQGQKPFSCTLRNGIERDQNEIDNERRLRELEKAQRNFELAAQEWDDVNSVVPGVGCNFLISEDLKHSESISFNEALQFFQTTDLQGHVNEIRPVIERQGFNFIFHCLCGPPKLCRELVEERDMIFLIATCHLDNAEGIHMRVLQTIFKKLTGDRFDCPRYGRHWEQIGFQGSDPATDLRGVGFWGLMNLLYVLMNPKTLPLALNIYKLSQHETQNFPFVVMSINITAIVLQVLREELLNRICNKRKQVVAVINDFYVGVFLHLYRRWKNENKTISHSGFILKDVEAFAKRNPKTILKDIDNYLMDASKESAVQQQQPYPSVVAAPVAQYNRVVQEDLPNFTSLPVPPQPRPLSFVAAISSNNTDDLSAPATSPHRYVVEYDMDQSMECNGIIRESEQELFI